MPHRTFQAAIVLFGALLVVSCDVSNLAPEEPEPTRAEVPLSAEPVSFETNLSGTRTGRGLDLDEEGCARSPGFWCHKKDGSLDTFAAAAMTLLEGEGVVLADADALREAVCDTRHQLLRHLTSLALNLAAGFVDATDPLSGGGTVGEAFHMGAMIFLMGDTASREERNGAKDVLDRINNNENLTNACTPPPGGPVTTNGNGGNSGNNGNGGNSNGTPGGPPTPSATCTPAPDEKKIDICHIPPGNPLNAKTLSIAPSAWPAHEAHGDLCGPCP